MTPEHLKAIREAAEAAREANADNGDWEHVEDREGIQGVGNDWSPICLFGYLREEDHVWLPYEHAEIFAHHIATSNPKTVIQLVDEVEQLRRMVKMSGKAGKALSEATIESVSENARLTKELAEAREALGIKDD